MIAFLDVTDGMVIIECFEPVTKRPTGQLVLDALTDSVIYYKGDRFGEPYLSPDSRKLITVSHDDDGTTLLLQLLLGLCVVLLWVPAFLLYQVKKGFKLNRALFFTENGLEFSFDVKTSMNISDVTFFPSQLSHTYDMCATAVNKDDVLFVDLETGW